LFAKKITMSKFSTFLISILGLISLNAQNPEFRYPCQMINAKIDSSQMSVIPGSNSIVYLCQSELVVFAADGSGVDVFPQNDINYHQDSLNVLFIWNFDDGTIDTNRVQTHTYAVSGIYEVQLYLVDSNNCSSDTCRIIVCVSASPMVEMNFDNLYICSSDTFFISIGSDSTNNIVINPHDTVSDGFVFSVDTALFIPDGPSCPPGYIDIPIPVNTGSGAALIGPTSIEGVCIEIEHSWAGDLSFSLTCPDGHSVWLDYGDHGGDSFLGIPNESDNSPVCLSSANPPGTGFLYCWSENYPSTGTLNDLDDGASPVPFTDTVINYNYLYPDQFFIGFYNAGCHINGNWILRITDDYGQDNGYIFKAQMKLNGGNLIGFSHITDTTITGPGAMQLPSGQWIISGVAAGTYFYRLYLTDAYGCTSIYPFPLTVSNNNIGTTINGNDSPDALSIENYNCDYHAGAQYLWNVTHGIIASGQGTDSVQVLWQYGSIGYLSVVESIGGCSDSDTIEILIQGINDFTNQNCFSVFPNPTENMIYINAMKDLSDAEILHTSGQSTGIKVGNLLAGEKLGISVLALSPGVYFIRAMTEYGPMKISFVKQ